MLTELFVVLYNVGCGFTVDQEKCLSLEQCLTHLGRLSKCIVNEGKGISGAQTTRACDLNNHGVNTVDEYHRTHYFGVPIRTYTYLFIILILQNMVSEERTQMISSYFIIREYIDILYNICVIFYAGPVTYIYLYTIRHRAMDASACVRVYVCVYREQRF